MNKSLLLSLAVLICSPAALMAKPHFGFGMAFDMSPRHCHSTVVERDEIVETVSYENTCKTYIDEDGDVVRVCKKRPVKHYEVRPVRHVVRHCHDARPRLGFGFGSKHFGAGFMF